MENGKGIMIDITREEWDAFPKDKQKRMAFLLRDLYTINVKKMINDEDDNDGRN